MIINAERVLQHLTFRQVFFHPLFQAVFLITTLLMVTPFAIAGGEKTIFYLWGQFLMLVLLIYAFLFKAVQVRYLLRVIPLLVLMIMHPLIVMTGGTGVGRVGDIVPTITLPVALWLVYSGCTQRELEKTLKLCIYFVLADAVLGALIEGLGIPVPGLTDKSVPFDVQSIFTFGGFRLTGLHDQGSTFHLIVAPAVVAASLLSNKKERRLLCPVLMLILLLSKGKGVSVAALFFLTGLWVYRKSGPKVCYLYIVAGVLVIVWGIYFILSSPSWLRVLGGRELFFLQSVDFLSQNLLFGNRGEVFLVEDPYLLQYSEFQGMDKMHVHSLFLYWLTRFGLLYFAIMAVQLLVLIRLSPPMVLYLVFLLIAGSFQISLLRGLTIIDTLNVLLLIFISRRYQNFSIAVRVPQRRSPSLEVFSPSMVLRGAKNS